MDGQAAAGKSGRGLPQSKTRARGTNRPANAERLGVRLAVGAPVCDRLEIFN